MQQSNVIFANLFIAYFLFITLRGELPTYITLLRGGGAQGAGNAGALGGDILNNPITAGAAKLLDNGDILTDNNTVAGGAHMTLDNANQILSIFGP